jgi:hypothetical protein
VSIPAYARHSLILLSSLSTLMLVCMCSPSFYSTVVYQLPKNSNAEAAVEVLEPLHPNLVCASDFDAIRSFFQLARLHSLSHIRTRSFTMLVCVVSDKLFVISDCC